MRSASTDAYAMYSYRVGQSYLVFLSFGSWSTQHFPRGWSLYSVKKLEEYLHTDVRHVALNIHSTKARWEDASASMNRK